MKDESDEPDESKIENNNNDINLNLKINNDNDKFRNCKTDNDFYEDNLNDIFRNDIEEETNHFENDFYHKKRRNNLNNEYFKKQKGLSTISNQIKEEFSLDKLGKIKWAKEHSSANKPMNKIKEFTKSTKFCRCCNLPIYFFLHFF